MLSFAVFGLMIAVGVGYVASLGIRIGPPAHRINVSMSVADVNGLVVGSNVMLRGVPVGKVRSIESSVARGATINFYIDGQYRIPVNSEVRLENLSALGESYIGLVPRSQDGPMLRDGQRITTESIKQPPSISELATSVVRVLNQLDPAALERITNEADVALPDPNSVLPNLSHTGRLLRNIAADLRGRGRQNLENFQSLLRNADWLGPLLADLATQFRDDVAPRLETLYSGIPVWPNVAKVQDEIKFHRFFDRIQRLLDDRGADLRVLGDALLPHIKGIAGALLNFDPSQILQNILASVPEDGTITLHVKTPNG